MASNSNAAKRIAFIDLEDTVIEPVLSGWPAASPCAAIEKVKRALDVWKPDEVQLFSFAIGDSAELEGFNTHVKGWLQERLGHSIVASPTVNDDVIPAICRQRRLHRSKVAFRDVVDFLGKHEGFRLFVRDCFARVDGGVEVLLIDDAVLNESFEWPDLRIKGQIINVETL